MREAIQLRGMPALRKRFSSVRTAVREELRAGIEEALLFVEVEARKNLNREVYERPRKPGEATPDRDNPKSVYNQFQQQVEKAAGDALTGVLANTSLVGLWLEFGTDKGGTGKHFVAPIVAQALQFPGGPGGEFWYSHGHWVSGMKPIRFMSNALAKNKKQVTAIIAGRLRRAFDGFRS